MPPSYDYPLQVTMYFFFHHSSLVAMISSTGAYRRLLAPEDANRPSDLIVAENARKGIMSGVLLIRVDTAGYKNTEQWRSYSQFATFSAAWNATLWSTPIIHSRELGCEP